jgi:hypothetical protein
VSNDGRFWGELTSLPVSSKACRVPHLTLAGDANKHAYFNLPPLRCSGREQLFYVRNAVLTLNDTVLGGRAIERCEYRVILWQSDAAAMLTEPMSRTEAPFEMEIKHDFFKVCERDYCVAYICHEIGM